MKKDEGSAALLFSRLKAQLALSATCFRGIASFGRMAGIKEEFEAFKMSVNVPVFELLAQRATGRLS